MDFSKFFTKVANRRRGSMIRKWAKAYLADPRSIMLANGLPNTETFPFEEITVTYKGGTKQKLIGRELATALQYSGSEGHVPLLKYMREFQEKGHKPKYEFWNVVFTSGSQDGCSKIFESIIEQEDAIMMQTPTFTGTINAVT